MAEPADFLDDIDDNSTSDYLKPPLNGSCMVTSPTTDTLDSVILEPPTEDLKDNTSTQLNMEDNAESAEEKLTGAESLVTSADGKDMMEKPLAEMDDAAFSTNISSYFADSGDDFFDSLAGGPQQSQQQLGTDLFMSIAISKSEEDIRASEMNAREIKDSDVKNLLSPDEDGADGMRRQNSFLRKSEEKERDRSLAEDVQEVEDEIQAEVDSKGEEKDETEDAETEVEALTLIHHRDHKTSTSEPESIAFEGELDSLETEVAGLQLADFAVEGDEIEELAESNDKPGFMSQISRTSQHSDSTVAIQPQPPQQDKLVPPAAESTSSHLQGPIVGTTPSQLSPMGTPVHQAAEPQPPPSPVMAPVNLAQPVDQSDTPMSPFHQPHPDAKSGQSIFSPFGSGAPGDDAFSSILSMSDADRRHDAWIPSDATSHILKLMTTSPQGSYTPAVEQLSTPGVISNESQGDPVRDLVLRYMGEQEAIKRAVLVADSVTQDVDGLKRLIEAGCLRAAIDLTGSLLEQVGQGHGKCGNVTIHTPHSLQLWFCRLTLMVKLRMYDAAEAEMRAFQNLDTPDLYFQFYANSYPGRRGSMVSFSMRMLHAELPLLCGRSQESMDRLYYMLAVCNRIQTNLASDLGEDGSATHMTFEARKASQELWDQREIAIIYKIGSTMLSLKDYEGGLSIYNLLLEKDKNSYLELMAGIGRIHLQMGSIAESTRILKEVETECAKTDSGVSCHIMVSRGLLAMCGANFYDAYQHFKSAVQMQPHNTCAVNNMAVCSLYLGRLKDALNTLEQLVHSDPANTLHEGVLFNLCTLYELESSRALHKKQAILDLVSKHKGDGFPVACLKMT